MANIGEEIEIVNIPEPIRIPNTVPTEAPVHERELEEVPA